MVNYDDLAAQNNGGVDTSDLTKLFVGVISQGTLGNPTDFMPTESSLIESMDELQAAAHDNGAMFLAGIGGKLHYAISFANTFKHPDGTTEQAGTQRIVTGYNAKGQPKYKTVRNKFAKMTISIEGDTQILHKIAQINLGPVDEAAVNPTPFQLTDLNNSVEQNIVTNDTANFDTVVSPTPTEVVNIAPPILTPPSPEILHVAETFKRTPADLTAMGVTISTTHDEAKNNQIPVRFFYTPSGGVGHPAYLEIGASIDIPAGATEISLQAAQNYIRNTPAQYLVETSQNLNQFTSGLGLTPQNQETIYKQILKLDKLFYTDVSSQQILSGVLPDTGVVWAYRGKDGHIETNVPLKQVLAGSFD